MRKLITYALIPGLLAAAGCSTVDTGLRNTVVLHYQHVANVHRIDFTNPVALPNRAPVEALLPLDSHGFWAVFVLCALDVTGASIPSFYFDVDRMRVQYGDRRYGPLRPYTLRLDDTADINSRFDTPALADAIAAEIQRGPSSQVFRHGYYGHLDYRFAIYIPRALPDYSGDQLSLRYEGGQTLALGNDYSPADVTSAGPHGSGVAAHCRP
ncbi:hypothetical protein [Massilia sp. Root335]|jgi:hypothetical protein|uniref:hypothetical protein n=1 Tax=Massilia sp. Root335 TaxID=1736517 RepID=UPI000700A22C|nr:hypothetical protein [Massilia sp. Root335]KQV51740.1 hypothetical protein ASC93_07350 [Massilia sp. Root335]